MFKTDGTKLTEIRVKIDLGRIADGVVVGLPQKKWGGRCHPGKLITKTLIIT